MRLDITQPGVVEAVLALQHAAYTIEAELLGLLEFEPLQDTAEDLLESGESYLCEGQPPHGVLGYVARGGWVDICRLMVHPTRFRRGVASRLLRELEATVPAWTRMTVSTGAENLPAVAFYKHHGFVAVGVRPIRPDLRILRLERTR